MPDPKPETIFEIGERIDVIVGPRRSVAAKRSGIAPLSAFAMSSAMTSIKSQFNVEDRGMCEPASFKTKSTHDEATAVHKLRMDIDQAVLLARTAGPQIAVEVDSHLTYGAFGPSSFMQQLIRNPSYGYGQVQEATVRFRVVGEGDKPLEGVTITMEAAGFPQDGRTNAKGELTLKLYELPGANLVKSIFVRPTVGHYNRMLNAPKVSTTAMNVIRLKPISAVVAGFPKGAAHGYGKTMMGLDRLPDEFTGRGVKIAIIDSGADVSHPSLRHITAGFDMTNSKDQATWKNDVIGHGSHCAGVITGNGPVGDAVRGFAPEAEVYVMKVFPGGQFSSLLDALAECVRLGVDVVNMSLGGGERSDMVEQQIEECAANGIACIVAAGNSGGPVQYPASSGNVLAVAAIGQAGQFPQDTWEQTTMQTQMTTPEGLFSPSFTCFGPEIGVAAPGVAIVSTVPGGGFDPQSGTSMAAPHVCGMAALMMAHHPVLRAMPRDASRVSALFQMLKASAMPLPFGRERSGAGMPSLLNVMQGFLSDVAETDEENEVELASAGPRARRAGRTRRSTTPQTPSFGGYQAILVPQPSPVYMPQGFFFG